MLELKLTFFRFFNSFLWSSLKQTLKHYPWTKSDNHSCTIFYIFLFTSFDFFSIKLVFPCIQHSVLYIFYVTVHILCNCTCSMSLYMFYVTVHILCYCTCSMSLYMFYVTVHVLCHCTYSMSLYIFYVTVHVLCHCTYSM